MTIAHGICLRAPDGYRSASKRLRKYNRWHVFHTPFPYSHWWLRSIAFGDRRRWNRIVLCPEIDRTAILLPLPTISERFGRTNPKLRMRIWACRIDRFSKAGVFVTAYCSSISSLKFSIRRSTSVSEINDKTRLQKVKFLIIKKVWIQHDGWAFLIMNINLHKYL